MWYHLSVLLVFGFYSRYSTAEPCVTPSGRRSECITIYNCDSLLSVLRATPRNPRKEKYLRQSLCGFEGRTPKVCCGPIPNNIGNEQQNNNEEPSASDDSRLPPRAQCGKQTSGRIYGGTEAHIQDFPWMALLGYATNSNARKYSCGGALINQRYVLTAAHCVVGEISRKVGQLVTARLGEYDTLSASDCVDDFCIPPYQEVPVDKAIPNPSYGTNDKSRAGDLALVRLARRVTYNDYVQPICLSRDVSGLSTGEDLYVAGWGATEYASKSNIKLKLRVPFYDHGKCESLFKPLKVYIDHRHVCAGGEYAKDSCSGDSGGPLMRGLKNGDWESVGVISFGNGCGSDGWPGVYSSVPAHYSWIEETLRTNG